MRPLNLTIAIGTAQCLIAMFTLAACGSVPAEPKVKIVESHIAVATSCIPRDKDPGPPKPYADANLPTAREAIAQRFQFIAAANEERKGRLAVLEPILAACR